MNRLGKKVKVRFFSIKGHEGFFEDFISIYQANIKSEKGVRIVNILDKKYFIKIYNNPENIDNNIFFLSIVRERNTWQTKALGDGTISSIIPNQGIVGDPYYYVVMPEDKVMLGFTTGPSGSLKAVGSNILQQFNKNRSSKISLEHIINRKEPASLQEISEYAKLHFKINTTLLGKPTENMPGIIKELCSSPFMANNSQIALTINEIGDGGLPSRDLASIVGFLFENNACSVLTVQGLNDEGEKVFLDFSKTHVVYETSIEMRNKFVDEVQAKNALVGALNYYNDTKILT